MKGLMVKAVMCAALALVVGCLPKGEGTPIGSCDIQDGEACTCSNGWSGVFSCESGELYCVCDEPVDMAMITDMAEVGTDMPVLALDMSVDADLSEASDMSDMSGELCGGVPCTCKTGELAAGWVGEGVGDVTGVQGHYQGEWCIEGAGVDIFGSADSFRFVHRAVEGDMDIVARVESFTGTDPWSKVGLMWREDTGVGARHASALVTQGNGSMLFYRSEVGGETAQTQWVEGMMFAPVWLKLSRRGDVFEASSSADGQSWSVLGEAMTLNGFPTSARVGLALVSKDGSVQVEAKFSGLEVIEVE